MSNVRYADFQVSSPCNDPTGKWGLNKVRDNVAVVGVLETVAITIHNQDGTIATGVTFGDVQPNAAEITIGFETYPAGTAVTFTKIATAGLANANLKARLIYVTAEGLQETTTKRIVLGPLPAL